jgi:hypothetical protein
MADSLLTRRQLLVSAGALAVAGPVIGMAGPAFADDKHGNEQARFVRWDLITITSRVILSGGTDVGKDKASGDTVSLTGSGQAQPRDEEATGGGTFVHNAANGTERAHGLYVVTGFRSFRDAGGTLAGLGLTDGIGEIDDTTGGILVLDVQLIPSAGPTSAGVLTVDCILPGGSIPSIVEGFKLSVDSFHFVQDTGNTLFHAFGSEQQD